MSDDEAPEAQRLASLNDVKNRSLLASIPSQDELQQSVQLLKDAHAQRLQLSGELRAISLDDLESKRALQEQLQSVSIDITILKEAISDLSAAPAYDPLPPQRQRYEPQVKYPKFRTFKTGDDPQKFVEDMEALLSAVGIQMPNFVQGVVFYCHELTRRWCHLNLLQPQLSWSEAKTKFIAHYLGSDAKGKRIDEYHALRQGPKESVSAFAEKFQRAAEGAGICVGEEIPTRAFIQKLRDDLTWEVTCRVHQRGELGDDDRFDYVLGVALMCEDLFTRLPNAGPRNPHLSSGKGNSSTKRSDRDNQGKSFCSKHGKGNHSTKECKALKKVKQEGNSSSSSSNSSSSSTSSSGGNGSSQSRTSRYANAICKACNQKGHTAGWHLCPLKQQSGNSNAQYSAQPGIRSVESIPNQGIPPPPPIGPCPYRTNQYPGVRGVQLHQASYADFPSQTGGWSRYDMDAKHSYSTPMDDLTYTPSIQRFSVISTHDDKSVPSHSGYFLPNHSKGRFTVARDSSSVIPSYAKGRLTVAGVCNVPTPTRFRPSGSSHPVEDRIVKPTAIEASSKLLVPCIFAGLKQMALIDSGADTSTVDPSLVKQANLTRVPVLGSLKMADRSLRPREGYVLGSLLFGDKSVPEHRWEIMPCDDLLIIGKDLFTTLGISILGLPVDFPSETKKCPGPAPIAEPANSEYSMNATDANGSSADAYTSQLWLDEDRAPAPVVETLLSNLSSVLDENSQLPRTTLCTHPAAEIRLGISPDAPPVFRQQYPIPFAVHSVVDRQIDSWRDDCIICPAPPDAPDNVPLLAARKKDIYGQWTDHRICLDFRGLNKLIPDDKLALPRISELFSRLKGFRIATALDLESSYNQFPLHPDDRRRTTFTWRRVRYMFVGCPFGLKPLTHVFQNAMEQILDGCDTFCIIFVDDIIVFSRSVDSHAQDVNKVVGRLNRYNLRLNLKKCHFGYIRLRILGHILSHLGRTPDPRKLSTMMSYPKPKTGKQVQRLLGFVNYLREYIPRYAVIASPLEPLRSKKDLTPLWGDAQDQAMDIFRRVLSHPPVLEFPVDSVPYQVGTDASKRGVSAVLFQEYDGKKHYITFVSKAVNAGQQNYSATHLELLAVIFALQRLRQYLYGVHFTLHTDHRALVYLFSQKQLKDIAKRWMDVLMDYTFTIVHCPGILNLLPDILSRCYPSYGISRFQVRELLKFPDHKLADLVSKRFDKRCPPASDRPGILQRAHALGHFGGEYLYKQIWSAGMYWPKLRRDCFEQIRSCATCLRYNVAQAGFLPLRPIHAKYPFDHVAIDLFGPMPVTSPRGYNFVLVFVDVCTRFVILRALPNKSKLTIARRLWEIFTLLGFPMILQSDRGGEFMNGLLTALTKLMGVDHRLITPYHPQANGVAEVHVRISKVTLFKMAGSNLANFDLYLPAVQFAMNCKVSRLTKTAPFTHALMRPINPPADYRNARSELLDAKKLDELIEQAHSLIMPTISEGVRTQQAAMARRVDAKRRLHRDSFPNGTFVMIKDMNRSSKHEPRWVGPYTVVDCTRAGNYTLVDSKKDLLKRPVPVDQMKLVALPQEADVDTSQSYVVEDLLDHRGADGAREYLVKWAGYSDDHNSWEPEGNFDDVDVIRRYWERVSQ
jgi:hypothetical protein